MDYYEKYWKKEIDGRGVAQMPPEWEEPNLLRILKIVEPYCRGHILDLGCGKGFFSHHLSGLKGVDSVVGIDACASAVTEAQKNYSNIIFKQGDITELSFENEVFDFISVSEVAEHLLDVKAMFESAYRVLKKEGYLFISTTDYNFLKKIIIALFFWDRNFYPTNPHIRFFTKNSLEDLLIKTGFRIEKYVWNGSYFGLMPKGQIVVAKKK